MTADFTLGLREPQANAVGDFLDLRATIACRGFAGHTVFSTARRDIDRFLADVDSVRARTSDSAQLLGGWDPAEERLRLRITRAEISGQFLARVRIATTGPREDQWNKVETEFVCTPDHLAAFLTNLRQLAEGQGKTAASLAGDSDATA